MFTLYSHFPNTPDLPSLPSLKGSQRARWKYHRVWDRRQGFRLLPDRVESFMFGNYITIVESRPSGWTVRSFPGGGTLIQNSQVDVERSTDYPLHLASFASIASLNNLGFVVDAAPMAKCSFSSTNGIYTPPRDITGVAETERNNPARKIYPDRCPGLSGLS